MTRRPIVFSPAYSFAWPGHVFPTGKYRGVAEALSERGLADGYHDPIPATRDELLTSHLETYLDRLEGIARGELPWDARFEVPVNLAVLDAFKLSAGGTIKAARLALEHGYAANIGGGFHHAYPDHGEGFCLLNDVVTAGMVMLAEGAVERVLVVDLDVHQGNGTAVAAAGEERLFTFSLHQENNYPEKEKSDLDVGLPDFASDEIYLGALADALEQIAARFSPDLVFYLAGADPYEHDRLGGLLVTMDGLAARDRMVFDFAAKQGAPVVATLAGGYATREEDVVEIHVRMIEELLKWGQTPFLGRSRG
jgi:acetoin utilization deacetylase AcuC-like enzyme